MSPVKLFFLVGLFLIIIHASSQERNPILSRDLTAENIFTENIEGPNVDSRGNLFVVNFQKNGTIGQVHTNGKVDLFVTLPEGSTGNSIMFDSRGDFLVADFTGHNVLKINRKTKAITTFCHQDQFNQPNDLCINRKGQLFASDPNWKDNSGQLWRIENEGTATLLKTGMGTTNGIELNPDENILYVNESNQRKIWAFDVDASGNISHQRLFFQFDDFGLDGMKCDNRGNLYVARHGKGTIVILSPQGKILNEIFFKGKKPSNLAFGGKDGRTCFVTLQDRKAIETFRSEFPGKRWH